MSQLEMFAQNIHLLIGILFACFCAVLLLITFVIGVKITWWQMRRVMAHRAIYGPKRDEQGRLPPQVFRGACTRCGNLFSVVYSVGEHRHLTCVLFSCDQVKVPCPSRRRGHVVRPSGSMAALRLTMAPMPPTAGSPDDRETHRYGDVIGSERFPE